jgi:hypothetical protein
MVRSLRGGASGRARAVTSVSMNPPDDSIASEASDVRRRQAPVPLAAARLASLCAWSVLMLGVVVLLGWLLDLDPLKRVAPDLASMRPNTALALIALGVALARTAGAPTLPSEDWILTAAVGGTLLVSGLTILEYAAAFSLGIDQLLFRDNDAGPTPGRMSPVTAGALAIGGMALLLPQARAPRLDTRFLLWAIVLVASATALIGYAVGSSALYRIGPFAGMAVHTAVSLALLATGEQVLVQPTTSLGTLLAGGTAAEGFGRYVLAVSLILMAAWIRHVLGETVGYSAPYLTFFQLLPWWRWRPAGETASRQRCLALCLPCSGRRALTRRLSTRSACSCSSAVGPQLAPSPVRCIATVPGRRSVGPRLSGRSPNVRPHWPQARNVSSPRFGQATLGFSTMIRRPT